MRTIVTGAAGFIGSHLTDELLRRGHTVVGIDNLSTGSIKNLQNAFKDSGFNFYVDDVGAYDGKRVLQDSMAVADVVFHLAAVVGVKKVVAEPVNTIRTNVRGTENVLETASEFGVRTVIASTSEVYGLSDKVPFTESSTLCLGETTKSRWGYACSKALDEFLGFAYLEEKKLPVTVVRFFNCSWARQSSQYGMVLPTFIQNALENKPLLVHGTGEQVRCFGAAPDYVDATICVSEFSHTIGEVYNIGNPDPVTINELATRVLAAIPSSTSEIKRISYDEAYGKKFQDMAIRIPSVEKIRRDTGWAPTKNLDDIIRSILNERLPLGA